MNYEQAKALLEEKKQTQLLRFYEQLNDKEKETLLSQIEKIDWSFADALMHKNDAQERGEFAPLGSLEKEEIERRRAEFEEVGIKTLGAGKTAAVLFAGGQGTRLGLDKPKGTLNVGVNKVMYLFEAHINYLLSVKEKCGAFVPLYIMTSEINHEDTVNFFNEHDFFGYDKDKIQFFIQDMAVATDFDGKILLKSKGELALSPNGNGGWFSSLERAGFVQKMLDDGIEYVSVFSVDNVLQKINDPAFVGAAVVSGADCTAKVVRKANAYEKIGVMCLEDGRPSIVEYIDVTEEMAQLKDENGNFAYDFGVILNYMFRLDKLIALSQSGGLPIHVVEKKVPYIDENGDEVVPTSPNGHKFETLCVDMIHLLDSCLPYEVYREKEFAPIKNMHGVDSLDSARELMKLNNMEF